MKRKNALILFIVLAAALLVLDRATKIIAIEVLSNSGPVAFLPAFLDFVLVYNTGGAFGLFEGGGVLFVGVALIAVVAIVVYLIKAQQLLPPVVVALSLIAAGALGNAYDRAVSGAVPDFIHTLFIEFPVFNVADCCLTIGEAVLVVAAAIYWFRPKKQPDEHSGIDQHGAETAGRAHLEANNPEASALHEDEQQKGPDLQASLEP
ncbi:MAG: signal peptidase II [Coriobacteriales bacterium]|nr:signal peptidase II [Coriobacteriales bacterium]